MSVKTFFSEAEQKQILEAIKAAELNTSGEIRVHLENFCPGNEIKRAIKVFKRLGMDRTRERNGILIYLAVRSRKIAIIGDEGIHEKLGKPYWDKTVEHILEHFRTHQKGQGLSESIMECGKRLSKFFPRNDNDKNELSDAISY